MTRAPLHVVPPPEPDPPSRDAYAETVPAGARIRIDVLAAKVRRVQSAFSGSFITTAMLTEARRLAVEIARDAALLAEVLG